MIDKLKKIAKPMSQKSIDELNYRRDNRVWLSWSAKIAIKIRKTLKDRNTSIEQFSEMLNMSLEQVNAILSGKYNFTLKEISQIESMLNINFIKILCLPLMTKLTI